MKRITAKTKILNTRSFTFSRNYHFSAEIVIKMIACLAAEVFVGESKSIDLLFPTVFYQIDCDATIIES